MFYVLRCFALDPGWTDASESVRTAPGRHVGLLLARSGHSNRRVDDFQTEAGQEALMPARYFYFDPSAEGTAVFMGPTEARLMEIAWSRDSVTVKQALFQLGETNRLAYTTVMTVLSRLADKQLLSREKAGRNFVYRPRVDKATYLKTRVKMVTDSLSKNFANLP